MLVVRSRDFESIRVRFGLTSRPAKRSGVRVPGSAKPSRQLRYFRVSSRRSLFWKSPYFLFALVLLLTTVCKLLRLSSRELWLDETYSAYVANLGFAECYRFIAGDLHPRLFHLILWCWVHVFGEAPTRLRLFSVVLSVFATIGMFLLGRRVLGARAAVFCATLFALSPTLFVYSLEVRNYMLLVVILVFLLNAHWAVAVKQESKPHSIVLYALLAAALFYNHYLAIMILFALLAHWIVISRLQWKRLRTVALVALLTALFTAPGVPLLLRQHANKQVLNQELTTSHTDPRTLSNGVAETGSPKAKELAAKTVENVAAVSGILPVRSHILLVLCALPLVAAFGLIVYLWLARGDEVCRMAVIFGFVFSASVVAAGFENHRYFIPVIPILLLAFARVLQWAFAAVRQPKAALLLGTAIIGIYVAGFYRQAMMKHGRPWSNVVSAIQQRSRPGDTVLFDAVYAQIPFDYEARQHHLAMNETGFPVSVYEWWNEQSFKAWGSPILYKSDLDKFENRFAASGSHTIWLVEYESYYYDPHDEVLDGLGHVGHAVEVPLPEDPDDRGQKPPAVRLFEISR
jgi:4-amino-4-deoxy-L-arabinose transferase-like glycosyltransferase